MTTITLTEEQRLQVKADMEGKELLSDEEVEALASKLNARVNIPFISEGTEQTVLVKIVRKFDRYLYKNLPNELYKLVKLSHDGISDADAVQLAEVLGRRLNSRFDIPYLPEFIEEQIFKTLLGFIVNGMRKQFSVLNQPEPYQEIILGAGGSIASRNTQL